MYLDLGVDSVVLADVGILTRFPLETALSDQDIIREHLVVTQLLHT